MSRKARMWNPNSIMHITCRGNRKEVIFKEYWDYKAYMKLINECIEYFEGQFEILSYVLMSNHIHIQVYTKQIHIGVFMQKLNNAYARYFNKKYSYVGHLFQGRYNSNIIDNDIYLLEASRYIHLNPVRANIVSAADQYEWSSFGMYIGTKREEIINSQRILEYFAEINKNNSEKDIRKLYKCFVEDGIR